MADILMLPSAKSDPVIQTRRSGRLPKSVAALWQARQKQAARDHQESTNEQADANAGSHIHSHLILTVSGAGVPDVATWGVYQADPARASAALHAAVIAFDRQFRICARSRLQLMQPCR